MRSKVYKVYTLGTVIAMDKLYSATRTETEKPIQAVVKATIPAWVEGSLYRNGPGMFEFGEKSYNHFFDGMAMVQRFQISEGSVSYQRRFLRTESYTSNTRAKTTVSNAYGTAGVPDPCLNIFQRFMAKFTYKATDNTLVSLFPMADELYATTETCFINKLDPESLDVEKRVDLDKCADFRMSAAHPHWENNGRVHYIGHNFKRGLNVQIITLDPNTARDDGFPKPEVACTIPSPWKIHTSYFHSFAITEHYYILVQQSLMFNVPKIATMGLTGHTPESSLIWCPDTPVRFCIVDRQTGKQINSNVIYEADPFLLFHHANAYEEDGHVIIDLITHKDKKIIEHYYMKNLVSEDWLDKFRLIESPQVKRFVLPLNIQNKEDDISNLVTLKSSDASCVQKNKHSLHCTPEVLADVGAEFPTISYDRYNGKKYTYMYCMKSNRADDHPFGLLKIDTKNKIYKEWAAANCYPSEPIFVPRPDGVDEDDGVVLAAVNRSDCDEGNFPFLLVLDARTFEELGRAEIHDMGAFPGDLHGIFKQN